MSKFQVLFALIITVIFIIPQTGQTCTAFCLDSDNGPLVGKNYDWNIGDGLIIVNKRDLSKTAATPDNPVSWVSKYGSVTFNQYGREMPNGGMNEAGLVVEVLWLNDCQYPRPDSRPALGNMQWIQYQLDNYSTVAEVIAGDSKLRINPDQGVKVHYFVCDSSGAGASIEFLGGKMVYHTDSTMPAEAITNSTYAESFEYLKRFNGFGGDIPIGKRDDSIDPLSKWGSLMRFVRAADHIARYEKGKSNQIDYMFETLSDVDSGTRTQWSIVYNIETQRVYFKTISNAKIKYFDLGEFDFDCDKPVKMLNINVDLSGNVAGDFEFYSVKANRNLLERTFKNTGFIRNSSSELLDAMAAYPEMMTCGD
ncbi:MAG: linear amide C-N hydrolase [candidate division Zixibacteria bacterium]|nr:linear amide C-N hydrolase [candidate division Zixibacteria bacterium]